MQLQMFRASVATTLVLATSACGGGNTVAMIAPPPITASPPPTPPPTPAPAGPAIPAALQTASPASPLAAATKFSTLTQATEFPLLMAAALGGPGNGDATTTTAGGVLGADQNGTFKLTINNPALGISNVDATTRSQQGVFYTSSTVNSANLDYTRFGYWSRDDGIDGVFNLGAWTTGFVTPTASLPAQGTATYAGKASGLYNVAISATSPADFDSSFKGDVSMSANFGTSTLSGAITNITATSLYSSAPLTGPVNDIGFSASIDRTNGLFAGTSSVAGQATGPYAFGPTASGLINGRFYGPSAAEVGAVFNLSEGSRRLLGSFGAKQ